MNNLVNIDAKSLLSSDAKIPFGAAFGVPYAAMYAGCAEGCYADLMSGEELPPFGIRDIGTVLYWFGESIQTTGGGYLQLGDACFYDLRPFADISDPPRETFVCSPLDEAERITLVPLSEIPQYRLEFWNACGSYSFLNPLLKARLTDLLRVRNHGDAAEHGLAAINAYLQTADLRRVSTSERITGLLRAYELCRQDSRRKLAHKVRCRIDTFLQEYSDLDVDCSQLISAA